MSDRDRPTRALKGVVQVMLSDRDHKVGERRSKTDRRSEKGRRVTGDRRKVDEEFEGPNRRKKGDRRSGENRRSDADRRGE